MRGPHPLPLSRGGRGDKVRSQRGQAIVVVGLMLTVIVGMAAIAMDGARAYTMRRDLQDATDASVLAAADKLQQTGSYASAEQAATSVFATNMRLYTSPSCGAYGSPGAAPWTVTCTYPDGTALTQVVRAMGPQGTQFALSATRHLQLQFAGVLSNGVAPTLGASGTGAINNLLYAPAVGALNGSGCGGPSGSALIVNGSGTLNVGGDIVSNGAISVLSGAVRVAGDVYARCQGSVTSASTACYPSGAGTPCSYPDVAGSFRTGFRLADPGYPMPAVGGAQSLTSGNVVVLPGIYSAPPILVGGGCWFLSGGVYDFQWGAVNLGDFVSNELKPPDEPDASNNTVRATTQFWNTNGVRCAGAAQASVVPGPGSVPTGSWAFVLTSVRTDTYAGVSYARESAASMCYTTTVVAGGSNIQVSVSNVPGATSYNIYASPPGVGGTCAGPFGLAANLPVTGAVQNNNLAGCPSLFGIGCSLGNESIRLDNSQLGGSFSPSATAAPGTNGAYPPDGELAPLASGLPNRNPGRGNGRTGDRGNGRTGDRGNENQCRTVAGGAATCPGPVTPGAAELYFPNGACLATGNGADTYVFSGYQYDWISVYEPSGNTCGNLLGAHGNSALIGLFYAPSASVAVSSPYAFEAPGVGGVLAGSVSFSGTLPAITFSVLYAPVPPAARIVS